MIILFVHFIVRGKLPIFPKTERKLRPPKYIDTILNPGGLMVAAVVEEVHASFVRKESCSCAIQGMNWKGELSQKRVFQRPNGPKRTLKPFFFRQAGEDTFG